MATWGEVKRWQPGPLQGAVEPMNGAYNKVVACGDDLRDTNTPYGWSGEAASAAAGTVNQIIDGLEEHSAELAASRRGVGDTGDAITGIQHGVQEIEELAAKHHFTVGEDGTIIDSGPPPDIPEDQRAAVETERKAVAAELRDRVGQVLRSATDVDDDFCAVLDKILSGHTIDASANDNETTSLAKAGSDGYAAGSLSIPAPPPDGATAAQNAAYWATISKGQRTQLAMDRPQLVGPRDGFSAVHRDIANQILLGHERTRLQSDLWRIQQDLNKLPHGPGNENERNILNKQLSGIQGKLDGVNKITEVLSGTKDAAEGRKHYLLGIDGAEDGKAIVATGNPDSARNVATFVPGTGSDLATLGGNIDRADVMHRAAEKATSEPNSVITWLGYDAPDSILNAGSAGYAEDARSSLDSFQDGLRESHNPGQPSHNTIIGHSYGSTVAGFAARDEHLAVDDFIAVGSPGVGVDDATGLHLPPEHVWGIAAENDPVADLQRFGNAPTDADFGANKINADAGVSWPVVGYSLTAHSQYWDPRNPALAGMGQVIAGKQPH
ncbi:alpha/beta hydrolase [Amycolatopsis nigrescens]|uniref:alpha/beta hydrolase n=1 Tax=Amycolatopsis nigrescens TaxID=381445 RepID=UPI0003803BF7|nr:alpha/beta hydrolase [Amycolatopsis nigrescens]